MLRLVLTLFLLMIPVEFLSAAAKPNIILITIDSARSDRMGFLGAKQGITPNLDSLARQSIIFEQAYAQAPTTVVSYVTMMTGTYPQTHHASEFGASLAVSLPYLPDSLLAREYQTGAFVESIALSPLDGGMPGIDRGFRGFEAERNDAELFTQATNWLDHDFKVPFFLWIQISGAGSATAASYNKAISAADATVGKLLTDLRTRKFFNNALIVVTAGRGASLSSHGEDLSGVFLYDETIHVPLLMKLPQNQDAAKRVRAKVALVSIAPTILELSGTPVPSQMQGQSLVRIAKGNSAEQPVYSHNDFPAQAYALSQLESWRAGKFLYIRAPKPELYDLSVDPAATHNLAQTAKATLGTMAGQLYAFDLHFNPGGAQSTQLTSSEMQKLASLGYVGMQKPAAVVNPTISGADPKDNLALINKISGAAAWLEQGKPEKAQALLEGTIDSAPNMYQAQYILAVALAQQQKYAKAIPYLHHAIELQPNFPWAHYQMGAALLKNNDYKTAAVHLEIAADRLPNFSAVHALLAQAYARLGKTADAAREKAKAQ